MEPQTAVVLSEAVPAPIAEPAPAPAPRVRKRKCISVADKLEAVDALDRGEKAKDISAALGVSQAAISKWRKTRDKLEAAPKGLKKIRGERFPLVNAAVLQYLENHQMNASGKSPTWHEICAFARETAKRLVEEGRPGYATFRASGSWLQLLLKRNTVRRVRRSGTYISLI